MSRILKLPASMQKGFLAAQLQHLVRQLTNGPFDRRSREELLSDVDAVETHIRAIRAAATAGYTRGLHCGRGGLEPAANKTSDELIPQTDSSSRDSAFSLVTAYQDRAGPGRNRIQKLIETEKLSRK